MYNNIDILVYYIAFMVGVDYCCSVCVDVELWMRVLLTFILSEIWQKASHHKMIGQSTQPR